VGVTKVNGKSQKKSADEKKKGRDVVNKEEEDPGPHDAGGRFLPSKKPRRLRGKKEENGQIRKRLAAGGKRPTMASHEQRGG